jgi:hypothetical protein
MDQIIQLMRLLGREVLDAITARRDDAFNLAALQRPETFVGPYVVNKLRRDFPAPAIPGTVPVAQMLADNSQGNKPMVVYVRANNAQQTPVVLMLNINGNAITPSTAMVSIEDAFPSVPILLRPKDILWGTVLSTPDASILAIPITLTGRRLLGEDNC